MFDCDFPALTAPQPNKLVSLPVAGETPSPLIISQPTIGIGTSALPRQARSDRTTGRPLHRQHLVAATVLAGVLIVVTTAFASGAGAMALPTVSVAGSTPTYVGAGCANPIIPGTVTFERTGVVTAPLAISYSVNGTSAETTFAAGSATRQIDVTVDPNSRPEATVTIEPGDDYVVGTPSTATVGLVAGLCGPPVTAETTTTTPTSLPPPPPRKETALARTGPPQLLAVFAVAGIALLLGGIALQVAHTNGLSRHRARNG